MKPMRIFVAFILALLIAAPAQAAKPLSYYNYAHNEAEYSVMLPEAPTSKTIWADNADIWPYLENPPGDLASLGEVATFKRVDIDSEDTYDVKITFLKAKPEFLDGITEEKAHAILKQKMKETPVQNETFHFSADKGPLKWASLSGFTLDKNHHPAFHAIHYLTGQESILVVEVVYSVENKTFQEYYKTMVDNIRYTAP